MCRVRFRIDGIYLSFPYIELSEEPSYQIRDAYDQPLISAVPRTLLDKHILAKGSVKQIEGASQNEHGKTLSIVEDEVLSSPSTPSSPRLSDSDLPSSDTSLPSSSQDDDVDDYDEGYDRILTATQRGKAASQRHKPLTKPSNTSSATLKPKNDVGGNHSVDDSKTTKAQPSEKRVRFAVSSSPIASFASCSKQVRFSDVVEERSIPSDDEYEGSDEASDSSVSSHSSRDSNIDQDLHVLLEGAGEPKDGYGHCGTNSNSDHEDHISSAYIEIPRQTKARSHDDTKDDDKTASAQREEYSPSDNHSDDSPTDEEVRRSRFGRQKSLSPLVRSLQPEYLNIEPSTRLDTLGASPRSKHDLRRSRDSGQSLRTQYSTKKPALKGAMKKERERYKPPYVDERNQGSDIQVDAETGMTWRDV